MKRRLLTSTALTLVTTAASPALAADPIKLELRGYFQAFILLGRIDRDVSGTTGTSYRPETFRYEGEIWFSGQSKLDNGTTIGIRVELEAWSQGGGSTSTNDQMDEEYIFAFGDWGRIEFGGTNDASYKMVFAAPTAVQGWGFQDPSMGARYQGSNFSSSNNAGRGGTANPGMSAAMANNSGDANKFSYFSPRIAGFQVGASYTPQFSRTASLAQCASNTGGGNINNCPRDSNAWSSALDIGANYLNKFGDVTVALYGGYFNASFDRGNAGGANNNNTNPSANGRWKSWAAGAQVGVAGFTLGGGIGRDNNGLKGNNGTRWYAASLMYGQGPWMVSAGWWGGRNDERSVTSTTAQNRAGRDKIDIIEIGGNYMLSSGIRLVGGFSYVMGSGQSKSEKADAWAFLFGTVLTF
ncbi:porin [Reyranella sp. CPCC 100927]|uniref:porin n=1 Tax=Reyranella sp. CPCC 100927 TaxID=2599616 RepID=UPI0011B6D546|nr:porin [Reyranella sp. CPCC 100927]TWT13768.1 porin [Reyranella sp. CPCC 100927]